MAGTMSLKLQESAIIEDVLFTMMVWSVELNVIAANEFSTSHVVTRLCES